MTTSPEDVAVTGIDGVSPEESMLAELTSIVVPKRRMAGSAVEQLIRRIDGVGGPAQEVVEPHGFRTGTTCGCPPRPVTRTDPAPSGSPSLEDP